MTTETANSKNKPSHKLYQVSGEGEDAIWSPVASAWPHKDGKGYTILVPIIGRIVMREIAAKSDDTGRLV